MMKRAFLLPPLLFTPLALAQVTDGSFELGTFNEQVTSSREFTFVESAEAHSGSFYGSMSAMSTTTGNPLRILTIVDIGTVEPGATYALSFYAKAPVVNGFPGLRPVLVNGGGTEARIAMTTIDAPTSFTAVWMIYSYQFSVPVNWNPENVAKLEFLTNSIPSTIAGQTYSFHMDDLTLGLVSAVPEPASYGILAGLAGLFLCGKRRRRTCTSP